MQLYWLRHTGTDVYHGSIGNMKHSYHESGQVHFRDVSGEFKDKRIHVPLAELQGLFMLGTLVFKNSPGWFEGDSLRRNQFRGSKADALLTLDSRALPESSLIVLTVGLLKPGELELLGPIVELWTSLLAKSSTRQLLIESSVSPWVWANVITVADDDINPEVRSFAKKFIETTQDATDAPSGDYAWHFGPIWPSDEDDPYFSDIQAPMPDASKDE